MDLVGTCSLCHAAVWRAWAPGSVEKVNVKGRWEKHRHRGPYRVAPPTSGDAVRAQAVMS